MMTNKENENKSLEEMMKLASEKVNESLPKKPKKSKKFAFVTVGAIVSLGVLLYIGSNFVSPQEFEDNTKNPEWVDSQIEKNEIAEENSEWNFDYPVDVPKWSKQEFSITNVIENEETYNELIEFSKSFPEVNSATAWMPSKEAGDWEGAPPVFTNNVWEEYLEDGTKNNRYSYTLKEDYLIAYASYTQQLINPTFGKWIFSQRYTPAKPMKDNSDLNVLQDIFSDEWWENNISENDYSSLPILADWNGDNFGGLEFAESIPGRYGTFFGIINENEEEEKFVTAEVLGADENDSPILKIVSPIKYVAFGIDDELIEKEGNLELTLKSNNEIIERFNRVVVSDAKLIFNN